ncbi:hypothetical protein T484DRAFT_1785126, partial [Baffinella frigidus]
RGASPNLRDGQRNTALIYALNARATNHSQQARVVRVLLEGGASATMENRKGAAPLALAVHFGLFRETVMLIRNGAEVDAENLGALVGAAETGRDSATTLDAGASSPKP